MKHGINVPCLVLSALLVVCMATSLAANPTQENWAERFPSKMTPGLEKALATLPAGGTLDVYAVMKNRLNRQELMAQVEGVPLKDRHKVVAKALRSFADLTQKEIRSYLAARQSAAAMNPAKPLWLSNAIRFTGTAEEIRAVAGFSDVGYLGVLEQFPIESYQDTPPPGSRAGIPFYDGFESGGFGPDWVTNTTGTGRIQVTSANSPIGNYHVTMDSTTSNSYGTCSMTLSLDLTGVTNCYLSFMFKEFGDESDPEDNISISADGITFYSVLDLSGGTVYEELFVDLDKAAANNGISFNNDFKVRFSWRDNYPIPTDGFAFDDIRVEPGDPPPSAPTPNIVKLQAPLCWEIGVAGKGALILNIDSGTDYNHTDLKNQIWQNPGEVPFGINGIDDDLNGYIDDFMGWDFESNDRDPYPTSYHGTATAGIVCGDGTAGTQTGMAPEATMAIAKIGNEGDYWEAQQYAVLIGARVITSSYSYKWGIHDPDYHMFRTNCVNELIAGVIHANSIGNQGDQTSSFPIPFNISAPGNCPGPWIHPDQVEGGISSVLGCAGVNLDETLYTPSGQGPSAWEDMVIYDPGYGHAQNPLYWDYPYGGFGGGQPGLLKPDVCTYTNVKTTELGGGYRASFGGTSAATPHLGGAMCLMVSGNAFASPRKISQAIQENVEDKGPVGKDSRYGSGKVQIFDALLRVLHNVQLSDTDPSIGDTIQLEISGIPGETYALVHSPSLGSTTFPGLGTFDLALPITIVYTAVIPTSGLLSVSIPINDPGLVGFKTYMQSIMDDRAGATGQILFSLVEKLEVHP